LDVPPLIFQNGLCINKNKYLILGFGDSPFSRVFVEMRLVLDNLVLYPSFFLAARSFSSWYLFEFYFTPCSWLASP
jgi:hypothetical protein